MVTGTRNKKKRRPFGTNGGDLNEGSNIAKNINKIKCLDVSASLKPFYIKIVVVCTQL